jgi:hypothetical protein
MANIDSFSFGSMTIDGRRYTSDLIIYPNGAVRDGWWRRRGHAYGLDDLLPLLEAGPEVVVAGLGVSGRVRPKRELVEWLEKNRIEFVAHRNASAVEAFNTLNASRRVGGCFHLTC